MPSTVLCAVNVKRNKKGHVFEQGLAGKMYVNQCIIRQNETEAVTVLVLF